MEIKMWGNVPGVSAITQKRTYNHIVEKAKGPGNVGNALNISGTAMDFQAVLKALKDIPDVRKDKVETLKDVFERGEYFVDSDEISSGIVKAFQTSAIRL